MKVVEKLFLCRYQENTGSVVSDSSWRRRFFQHASPGNLWGPRSQPRDRITIPEEWQLRHDHFRIMSCRRSVWNGGRTYPIGDCDPPTIAGSGSVADGRHDVRTRMTCRPLDEEGLPSPHWFGRGHRRGTGCAADRTPSHRRLVEPPRIRLNGDGLPRRDQSPQQVVESLGADTSDLAKTVQGNARRAIKSAGLPESGTSSRRCSNPRMECDCPHERI